MSGTGSWYIHEIRVRYQETDQMGVVYHINYLNWFEFGRTELIRELGLPYASIEPRGLLLPVTDVQMKFHRPAKYDDIVRIRTRISEYSNVKLDFEYEICKLEDDDKEQLLVSGTTRHVWINREWKTIRLDRAAPDVLRLIEEA